MRPAGEIRQAVLSTAWELAVERAMQPIAGATQHEVAARLRPKGVAPRAVRWTWDNLVRAGQLRPVGPVLHPQLGRTVQACAPVQPPHGQQHR